METMQQLIENLHQLFHRNSLDLGIASISNISYFEPLAWGREEWMFNVDFYIGRDRCMQQGSAYFKCVDMIAKEYNLNISECMEIDHSDNDNMYITIFLNDLCIGIYLEPNQQPEIYEPVEKQRICVFHKSDA